MIQYHPKIVVSIAGLALTIVIVLLVAAGILIKPKVVQVSAAQEKLSLTSPLVIQLNVPLARRALHPVITPEIEGSWHWQGGLVAGHLARTLVFEPEEMWQADQHYTVTLQGVAPVLATTQTTNHTVSFATKSLPTVIGASVAENSREVAPDGSIVIELDQSPSETVEFSFHLEPEAELLVAPEGEKIVVKPTTPLRQGEGYRLVGEREILHKTRSTGSVIARSKKEVIFERNFTTKSPPHLTKFEPQGVAVLPTTREIRLVFSSPMIQAEVDRAITLQPALDGSWQWLDDRTLVFRARTDLSLGTKYRLQIPRGVRAQDGSFFEQDTELSFSTIGALRVTAVSPGKKSGVSINSPIKLTFDQPVDPSAIVGFLSVSPAFDYTTIGTTNSLTVQPKSPLAHNTNYSITLRKGAKGTIGLESTTDFSSSFKTEERVVLLNVAWDRQDRALSCEAAALKMALAYKGVRVSEDEIMARVGYDPTPRTGGGWGDPDVAFVGDINGAQNSTGYGVHWAPIARAASAWRTSRATVGMTLQEAARELEAGNPIVIWGVTGSAYYDPWTTPAGKKVEAWKGEHARTLIGFKGSVDNPTSFVINDPQAGRLTWSASKLRSNWATFSYGAVVVY